MSPSFDASNQKINPSFDACYRTACGLLQQKRFDEAADLFRKALELSPTHIGAKVNLGKSLLHLGRLNEAITILSQAAGEQPNLAEAHGLLGNAYALSRRPDEAAGEFRRTLQLNPNVAAAHFGLGSVLADQGRIEDAISAFRGALRLNYPAAHCNLGVALAMRGEYSQAASELRSAIVFNPQDATAHWNLAILMLLLGDWDVGWREYEWRWRWDGFPSARRDFKQPRWNGQDLAGRTILLHAEQGVGDTIQFIRYVPAVAARGGSVVVECYPHLVRLLSQIPGAQHWLTPGEPIPTFDFHCPLLSLPLALHLRSDDILNKTPYLQADQVLADRWRDKMAGDPKGLRVGLVWCGSLSHINHRYRAVNLDTLTDLLAVEGATFYSLQVGPTDPPEQAPPQGALWIDRTAEIGDFSDTAALIANLDLIISVDTAVLHLAGAMGKPAWALIPKVPDWRWGLEGETSPWYPTIKLYRQTALGDWQDVVRRVARDLRAAVAEMARI
jgi:Flp pilus assembly protein TadD